MDCNKIPYSDDTGWQDITGGYAKWRKKNGVIYLLIYSTTNTSGGWTSLGKLPTEAVPDYTVYNTIFSNGATIYVEGTTSGDPGNINYNGSAINGGFTFCWLKETQ